MYISSFNLSSTWPTTYSLHKRQIPCPFSRARSLHFSFMLWTNINRLSLRMMEDWCFSLNCLNVNIVTHTSESHVCHWFSVLVHFVNRRSCWIVPSIVRCSKAINFVNGFGTCNAGNLFGRKHWIFLSGEHSI